MRAEMLHMAGIRTECESVDRCVSVALLLRGFSLAQCTAIYFPLKGLMYCAVLYFLKPA